MLAILVAQLSLTAQATVSQQPTPPPSAPQTAAQADIPWPPEGVVRLGKGVTAPRLMREIKPSYNANAMYAKIQGVVEPSC